MSEISSERTSRPRNRRSANERRLAYTALSNAIDNGLWVYSGQRDPIAEIIGKLREQGYEIVRTQHAARGAETAQLQA